MLKSKALDCPVFKGNNPLTGELIWASRVRGGSECIKEYLRSKNNWDGSSNVVAVAAQMEEDRINGWQLHAIGKRKGYKLDSAVLFPNQDKGTVMRIIDYDLTSFVFRDMVSDWLAPNQYKWEFRIPHEKNPNKYHRVETQEMEQYNAKPLWLRAFAQLVPGPKIQLTIGCAPALDIKEIPSSDVKEFPVIKLETFNLPFLPYEEPEWGLGLGPVPLLIDGRDELDFTNVANDFPDGQDIKKEMSKFLQKAIKPNWRVEINAWVKDVGNTTWAAREPTHTYPDPRPLQGDVTVEDADEDNDDGGEYLAYLNIFYGK